MDQGSRTPQGTVDDEVIHLEDGAIRPFQVGVPQEDLDDLRRRLAATRFPEKETVADQSQGVPLATMRELVRYWANDYDLRRFESRLNAFPQFLTEIDGLDIHFIHVRSPHENALPLIITHGWPGSIIEMLNVIGPLSDPTAHGGDAGGRVRRRGPVDARLRVLGQAGDDRLGPRPHRARLDRPDGAPRLHPLRRPGRRLGCADHGHDGCGGASGLARDPLQHGRHRSARRREGARVERPGGRRPTAVRISPPTSSAGTTS